MGLGLAETVSEGLCPSKMTSWRSELGWTFLTLSVVAFVLYQNRDFVCSKYCVCMRTTGEVMKESSMEDTKSDERDVQISCFYIVLDIMIVLAVRLSYTACISASCEYGPSYRSSF